MVDIQKIKVEARTIIGFNSYQYEKFKAIEDKLLNVAKDLKTIADACIGIDKIKSVKEYLLNPADYLIIEYDSNFGHLFPTTNSAKDNFNKNSNYTDIKLNELAHDFWKLNKELSIHAPTISKKGINSNLNKDSFNYYLDPSKEEHYNALLKFLKSAKDLQRFDGNGNINLVRYSPSIILHGIEAVINTTNFYKR